ncbi:MAG: NAD(P)/FAD-dependent oxidoreductase [Pseudomonadota bacterium]
MGRERVFDIIVLGGGAAGLHCAAVAGQRGRRVLVLEGSNKPGKKILMSGGGRCNFTNLNCGPEHFVSANPHFCKSALSRYTPYDFLAMVERHNIPWVEKAAGQLFCERSSKDIVAMLLAECDSAGVTLLTEAGIERVETGWSVDCAHGLFRADSLVVATGGLSVPKMGASGLGYELARQFGLDVLPTRAGLVPFTFTGELHEMMARLSGVSIEATLTSPARAFTENVLFTHRGLSGPAALQVSSFWHPGDSLTATLLPRAHLGDSLIDARVSSPKSTLRSVLSKLIPRALVLELQRLFFEDVSEKAIAELSNDRLNRLADSLARWPLKPAATEGYRTAEITLGGIDTDGISSSTMAAKRHDGLYFVGEVLDVTGQLGGFNFQWAWASAQAAGDVA